MVTDIRPAEQTQQVVQQRRGRAAVARDSADARAAVNRVARAWLLGAIIAGFGVAAFVRFYGTHFEHLVTNDSINVAQVARSVQRGRGLKSDVIYPLHTAIGKPGPGRHDIATGPLYPLALGMFFKGRGAEDSAVPLFNGILLFITAAFLYGLIKLAYDKSIAVWTTLAYFVSMEAISQALGAGGATIGTLTVTAALYFALMAVTNAEREPAARADDDEPPAIDRVKAFLATPWPWAVLAAITIGLSYLTGMVGWLAVAGLVWLASRHGVRTRKSFAIVAIIAIIVTAPWLARNVKHFGWPVSPLSRYSLIMLTGQFPGNSLMSETSGVPGSPELWAITNPGEMLRKLSVGLTNLYGAVPDTINRYLFPFLLVGVFVLAKTRRQRLLWGMVWFVLLAQVLTVAIYDRDGDPIAVVTPVALGLAVATLITLMRQHLTARRAFVGAGIAAAAIIAWPYTASLVGGSTPPTSPSKPTLDLLATLAPELRAGTVATDIPWQVAWYGGERAILLPDTWEKLAAMGQAGVPTDYIYLSGELRGPRVMRGREFWAVTLARVLQEKSVGEVLPLTEHEGFNKPLRFPNGEALVFLSHGDPLYEAFEKERAARSGGAAADESGDAETAPEDGGGNS